jgi:hypothetical protein
MERKVIALDSKFTRFEQLGSDTVTSNDRNDPRIEILASRLAYAYLLGSLIDKPFPEREKHLEAEGLSAQHWPEWVDEARALLGRLEAPSGD